MRVNGKPINKVTGWNDPPKDGKDHPLYSRAVETGQRAEPMTRKPTNEQKRVKYLLAMRELRKAEGTWTPEFDKLVGLEGLE